MYGIWKIAAQRQLRYVPPTATSRVPAFVQVAYLFLCLWARASWINVNNCPTRCDYKLFFVFLQTALHVSGDTFTHHQEHTWTVITASGTGWTVLLSSAISEEFRLLHDIHDARTLEHKIYVLCLCGLHC